MACVDNSNFIDAFVSGNVAIAMFTLKRDLAKIDNEKFIDAVMTSNVGVATRILKNNPNAVHLSDAAQTPVIILATQNDDAAMTELLINNGAFVDHKNSHGKTALFYAAEKNNATITEQLANAKANVNMRLPDTRETPLHIAAAHDANLAGRILILHGADTSALTARNETALDIAQDKSQHDFIGMFVSARREKRLGEVASIKREIIDVAQNGIKQPLRVKSFPRIILRHQKP